MNGEVDAAVEALDRGEVVVLPTETVYGLAARIDRPSGIEKIFALKERAAEKVLQVLVSDAGWLDRLATGGKDARTLARSLWPGSLTLVVRAGGDVPAAVTKDGSVGIRVPNHPLALQVLERSGPLAASSANRAGEPTLPRTQDIRSIFGDDVAVYVDGGEIAGTGSTVVDLTSDSPVLLREGPIPFSQVTALCAKGRFEAG